MNPTTVFATPERTAAVSGDQLERRLAELMDQDRFAVPQRFVDRQRVDESSRRARSDLDPNAFWAEEARLLAWSTPFTKVLDDSNPPFYKWFSDGQLNVSYNCLDRHVEAGRGNRVASIGPARRVRSARSLMPSYSARCSGSPTRSRTSVCRGAMWSGSTCP